MSARLFVATFRSKQPLAIGVLLLLTALTGSGCSTTPLVAQTIRGPRNDWHAVARMSPVPSSPAAETPPSPGAWSPTKEPERPVQWAEARGETPPPAAATQVEWRLQSKVQPAGPVLVEQPPLMAPQQVPVIQEPQPEQMPPPKVLMPAGQPPVVMLGAPVPRAPNELQKVSLPPYTVAPPDILLVESTRQLPNQPVRGQHLVRPDGTINLGIYGTVYVAGMTLDQIRAVVAKAIESRFDPETVQKNPVKLEDVNVDVLAYNSKVYYVITDGGGYGEQVYKFPATGNETVLDAIANITGLPAVASKKHIWVARRTPHGVKPTVLPVDWCGIAQRGETTTNYQLFPGDRVYVQADRLITADSMLAKILAPVERVLGVTLLGSSTVNSIRNRNTGGNNP